MSDENQVEIICCRVCQGVGLGINFRGSRRRAMEELARDTIHENHELSTRRANPEGDWAIKLGESGAQFLSFDHLQHRGHKDK